MKAEQPQNQDQCPRCAGQSRTSHESAAEHGGAVGNGVWLVARKRGASACCWKRRSKAGRLARKSISGARGQWSRPAAVQQDARPNRTAHQQFWPVGQQRKVFVVGASRRSAAPGNQFIDRFAHTTSCALRQRWWRGPQILSSPLASTKRRRHSWHAWRQSQPLVASTAPNRHVQRNLRVNA